MLNLSTNDEGVYIAVKNIVVVALWLPILIMMWGGAIGFGFIAYRFGRYGEIPDIAGALGGIDPLIAVGAVGGVLYILYNSLLQETFGSKTVDNAEESATEVLDDKGGLK